MKNNAKTYLVTKMQLRDCAIITKLNQKLYKENTTINNKCIVVR